MADFPLVERVSIYRRVSDGAAMERLSTREGVSNPLAKRYETGAIDKEGRPIVAYFIEVDKKTTPVPESWPIAT